MIFRDFTKFNRTCLTALENETALVKSFFDYLKRRHLVVRGGALPPLHPPAAARGLGRSRGIYSPPQIKRFWMFTLGVERENTSCNMEKLCHE